jgi:hypothetical protein
MKQTPTRLIFEFDGLKKLRRHERESLDAELGALIATVIHEAKRGRRHFQIVFQGFDNVGVLPRHPMR